MNQRIAEAPFEAPWKGKFLWCVPGTLSPRDAPIAIWSGLEKRFLETSIVPPSGLRTSLVRFKAFPLTEDDMSLLTGVEGWHLLEPSRQAESDETSAMLLANNVCAARRFLPSRQSHFVRARRPVRDENLYLGRSVHVHPPGRHSPTQGWIAGLEEPFDLVVCDSSGRFDHFLVLAECLGEDGTYKLVE